MEQNIKNDLTGKTFGRLTVLSFSHREKVDEGTVIFYLCRCECGNEKIIRGASLFRGLTKSCGCLQKEHAIKLGQSTRTDGRMMSAKLVWDHVYKDGCSFDTFLKLSQECCHYCGINPSTKFNIYINKNGLIKNGISEDWANQCWFIYNGLDRINSELDHREENIVPCCAVCNYAKSNMSIDEFRSWAARLYNNFLIKSW